MVEIEPPFYRGEEEPSDNCDFLTPATSSGACDAQPRYAVWWTPVPALDADTKPVSATCIEHELLVDRNLVDQMATHPLGRRSLDAAVSGSREAGGQE